jgi:hypothetical protein
MSIFLNTTTVDAVLVQIAAGQPRLRERRAQMAGHAAKTAGHVEHGFHGSGLGQEHRLQHDLQRLQSDVEIMRVRLFLVPGMRHVVIRENDAGNIRAFVGRNHLLDEVQGFFADELKRIRNPQPRNQRDRLYSKGPPNRKRGL